MKRLTSVLFVTAPSAAMAWLSNTNGGSYHPPLHQPNVPLMQLSARRRDRDEMEGFRTNLERAYKRTENFEELVDDDAILFLRAREEGTNIISADFLTTDAGIQIGLWTEDGADVCTNREECEQCAIPDDFKLSFSSEPIDVMSFLGIQRAEPLRVRRSDDWA